MGDEFLHKRDLDRGDPPRPHTRWTDTSSPMTRGYWTARGVVPRWQLFGVYLLIAAIGIVGFNRIGSQADRAEELSTENRALVRQVANLALSTKRDRDASIKASCERNTGSMKALIAGAAVDAANAKTAAGRAEIERRRNVTLGILAQLRPIDCPKLPADIRPIVEAALKSQAP